MARKKIIIVEKSNVLKTAFKLFFKKNKIDIYDNFDMLMDKNKFNVDLFIISDITDDKYNSIDFVNYLNEIQPDIPCVIYTDQYSFDLYKKYVSIKNISDIIIGIDKNIKDKFKKYQ